MNTVLPDIFLEADLSQAEGRSVLMLTADPEMIRLAQTKPWEFDMHVHNAAIVFETTVDALAQLKKTNKAEYTTKRQLGKKTVHGAQRDMKGKRLSDELLKDGFVVPVSVCDRRLEAYHFQVPAIRENYFKGVRKQLMRNKRLVNTWGRVMDFTFERLEDNIFREAYSFLPQSEVADLMNQWGLLPVYRYVRDLLKHPPNVQVHDSLLISTPPQHAYDIAKFTADSLERPIVYPCGEPLLIPVEFKLAISWGGDEKKGEVVEFKRMPSKKEFMDVAISLGEKRARELKEAA